eukprot:CAMPEP_0197718406 /NCGR_PEP_ID=MMETSP1434-20131217/2578_1 /TAXON_ID=265543 /ORGANISM="Minutocellus polymorphus, Strain CCMP3303" /LENGTH=110 /DNA_ID=CAMNT_0043303057 /DNA_START=3 /DNA_END=336 /DNA_ORIENTATION=-
MAYRMQQAPQEEPGTMYNNGGDEYRRDEYDRMAGQQQQVPRPQDEATWTRDDELRAVNDPYRRVDPSAGQAKAAEEEEGYPDKPRPQSGLTIVGRTAWVNGDAPDHFLRI